VGITKTGFDFKQFYYYNLIFLSVLRIWSPVSGIILNQEEASEFSTHLRFLLR